MAKKKASRKKVSAPPKKAAARKKPSASSKKLSAGGKKVSASSKKAPARKKPPARVKKAAKRALCVGINDYPYRDNDLNGCVPDAKAWAALLRGHYDFAKEDVKILLDKQATKAGTLAALKNLLAGARKGDVLVFTNSSHGSYVADTDGDEEKYDEVICPHDIDDNDIVDDELRVLFANLPAGVSLTVILDNCFSGTATRAVVGTPDGRRVRFLSPALRGKPTLRNPWTAKSKSANKYPESGMNEILLSGCTDKEYSYDASFGSVNHGALTYYALEAIKKSKYKLTYSELHTRLTSLITDYPQHPQLEGKEANKKRQIFT
ncbi:MAG: caspase family protein [bacterium]